MFDWNLKESIQRIIKYWWVIVGLCLIGLAAGLAVPYWLPPVYESRAVITVSLDFSRLGEVDDLENDHLLVVMGSLLRSTEVRQAVLQAAQSQNMPVAGEWKDTFFLDREGYQWNLRVRSSDPEKSAALANLWADKALGAFTSAYQHALLAEQLANQLDGLGRCLQQAVSAGPSASACKETNLEEFKSEIEKTGVDLAAEKKAARGMISAMTANLTEKAELPARSLQTSRGLLALAGLGLGLIAGILFLETGLLDAGHSRRRNE